MALSLVQVGLLAMACPLLGLLLRDVIGRRRVIPSIATGMLIVVTATPPLESLEAWSTAVFLIAFPFLLATFPDGVFVPKGALWPVLGWAALGVAFGVTDGSVGRQPWWSPVIALQLLLLAGQIYRYRRRATIEERVRTRWVVLATTVCIVGYTVLAVVDGGRVGEGSDLNVAAAEVLGALPAFGFAVGLAAPMLVDVDAAMRGMLTGLFSAVLLAPVYLGVSLLAAELSASAETAGWWGALAVAAAAAPAFRVAVRSADRVVFQGRPEPIKALVELGHRLDTGLDPLQVPDTVVRTVCESLFLGGAELRAEGVLAARIGDVGDDASTFPIVYQGEDLAVLAVSPRRGETGLTAHDRRIVEHLARQSASALHGARTIAQLVDARSKVVLAREEERRRLRRDLHDDLAPTLAGLGLGAAAIEHLARGGDPDTAEVAAELQAGIRAAARQVREIAYDLRPPVLDDLGLVAAIRDRLNTPPDVRPRIEVRSPGERMVLPAAVEVAALRIVQEAVANVRRHAAATECLVTLALSPGDLHIEILDDGRGLAPRTGTGVGLRSIHERAAELGGQSTVQTVDGGGVQVLVRLPIPEAREPGA